MNAFSNLTLEYSKFMFFTHQGVFMLDTAQLLAVQWFERMLTDVRLRNTGSTNRYEHHQHARWVKCLQSKMFTNDRKLLFNLFIAKAWVFAPIKSIKNKRKLWLVRILLLLLSNLKVRFSLCYSQIRFI